MGGRPGRFSQKLEGLRVVELERDSSLSVDWDREGRQSLLLLLAHSLRSLPTFSLARSSHRSTAGAYARWTLVVSTVQRPSGGRLCRFRHEYSGALKVSKRDNDLDEELTLLFRHSSQALLRPFLPDEAGPESADNELMPFTSFNGIGVDKVGYTLSTGTAFAETGETSGRVDAGAASCSREAAFSTSRCLQRIRRLRQTSQANR